MKIRTGFVSNSSSSSFVAFGARIDSKLSDKIEEEKGEDYFDELNLEKEVYGKTIKTEHDGYDGTNFIYFDLDDLKDDETLGEVKKQLQDFIKEEMGVDIPIEQIGFIDEEIGC